MTSIADATGHFWQAVWDDPANAELKTLRKNPETLAPGDQVAIPARRAKQVSCTIGAKHVFRRRGVPVKVSLMLRSAAGAPYAGKSYELEVGEARYTGTTEADGSLAQWVAPRATTGVLTVWLDEPGMPEKTSWVLQLGQLPPAGSTAGVQRRLCNLGYAVSDAEGELGESTHAALSRFQESAGFPVTGEADAATAEQLAAAHGS